MPKLPAIQLAETVRLYSEEKLSLGAIGERLGISKQAVHERLNTAGVPRRPRGGRHRWTSWEAVKNRLDVASLIRRYEDQHRR